jgi:histidyl-tRNA synthetase
MEKRKKIEPRIPSGFLEFLPEDQVIFNAMFETIRKTYERFGFAPIETPAIEFTDVLLTKSGGETEKQIYRLDKQGDDLSLHFDLTVPLARYVVEHYADLTFPFRRYQMQKVWRGERKQKGRFREFYQCDIDVVGTTNILVDAEIPSVIYEVFRNLGFDNFTIRINNRKVLNGFMEYLEISAMSREVLRAIDKLEKQGEDKVTEEIKTLGISGDKIKQILDFVRIKGSDADVISQLRSLGISSVLFETGIEELRKVSEAIALLGVPRKNYGIDLAIARGLDYYTGTVYETVLNEYPEVGSICSGGRFDDLAECYTDKKLPGVGISIGLTRLFFKLKEAGLIKSGRATLSEVLVAQMDEKFMSESLAAATQLRKSGINTEIYFDSEKIGKQFKYADRLKIPFVIIIGETESKENKISLKTMSTGEQQMMSLEEAMGLIKKNR